MKFIAKAGEERQAEINAKFHRVWCKNNAFSYGSLISSRWKLSPIVNDLDDHPKEPDKAALYLGFPFFSLLFFLLIAHCLFEREKEKEKVITSNCISKLTHFCSMVVCSIFFALEKTSTASRKLK